MQLPANGSCQCGNIRYVIKDDPIITVACHCQDCQKLSASAFSLTMVVAKTSFELKKGDLSIFERPTDAGGKAVCYFCGDCGNRVYHENPEMPEVLRVKPGGLDDTSEITPHAHVWVSRAQPWYEFSDSIPTFDTQPDLKAFFSGNGS